MNLFEKVKPSKIPSLFAKKGYKLFTAVNDMNLFAVRSSSRKANAFDDVLCIYYKDERENVQLLKMWCTVDPGGYWLQNPMEPVKGAAGIVPGQYPKLWQLGKFKGTDALLQVGRIRTFRDNDRDMVLDYDVHNITTDTAGAPYGIFLHEHFQSLDEAKVVHNSSAGCVVPMIRRDMQKLITILNLQVKAGLGSVFTFTLFDEADFD